LDTDKTVEHFRIIKMSLQFVNPAISFANQIDYVFGRFGIGEENPKT